MRRISWIAVWGVVLVSKTLGIALQQRSGVNGRFQEAVHLRSGFRSDAVATTTLTASDDGSTTTPHNPFFNKLTGQPLDAAVGASIIDFFIDDPENAKSVSEVSSSCPTLTDFPDEVTIDAPNPCGDTNLTKGYWKDSTTNFASWEETCSLFDLSLMPKQKYSTPDGDLLGESQMKSTAFGTYFSFSDCEGRGKVTLLEAVYLDAGGTVYLQYEFFNVSHTIARTGYIKLFSNDFKLSDMEGNTIVTIARSGDWTPTSDECTTDGRQWAVKFDSAGPFAEPEDRWPVAYMVTALSLRNRLRRDSGMVSFSWCTIGKTLFWLSICGILVALTVGIAVCLVRSRCVMKSQRWLHAAEHKVLGKRKHIQSRHDQY